MNRRNFLKSTAAITEGGMMAGYDALGQSNAGPGAVPGPKPNILSGRATIQPVLNPNVPTFGKLLRANGYQTPYTGKWHATVPQADKGGLEKHGFDFFTYYDPTGDNLQGTYGDEIRGYHNDSYSAGQGANWLLNNRPKDQPWRLTVSLVNPHDREFFPAGTEFKTVTAAGFLR